MACDRAEDRTLLLSLGLFGAPARRELRELEAQPIKERVRSQSDEGAAR